MVQSDAQSTRRLAVQLLPLSLYDRSLVSSSAVATVNMNAVKLLFRRQLHGHENGEKSAIFSDGISEWFVWAFE